MAVERKCLVCQTWNNDNDYCTNCGNLLSPVLIEEKRERERELRRNLVPPTKLDIFIDNWKNSRFLVLRVIYQILYGIAFIFFAIASFFAYLAASPNG